MSVNIYRLKEDRKRNFIALVVSVLIYLIAFLVIFIFKVFTPREYSDFSGPLHVSLGSSLATGSISITNENTENEKIESQLPALQKPVSKTGIPSEIGDISKPGITETKKETATANPAGSLVDTPAETVSSSIRGREWGNELEFNFEGGGGEVGRNIYVPVYSYMPLPEKIDDALYGRIADEKTKEYFRQVYEFAGDKNWNLKQDVRDKLQNRPMIWTIIQKAGYNLTTADYKMRRPSPSPVILAFSVTPMYDNNFPGVEDVKLIASSGYPDIDQAVIYGFKQAAFRNSTDTKVSALFTYSFH